MEVEEYKRYDVDEQQGSVARMMKKYPMIPIGIAAFSGIAAYGLYNMRRTKTPIFNFLIDYRLYAQGTFTLIIVLGAAYKVCESKFGTKDEKRHISY